MAGVNRHELMATVAAAEERMASKARGDLMTFTRYTFMEGGQYEVRWFHRRLASKLEQWADPEGDCDRLMIFLPFQHGKTELCSRAVPAWIMGQWPNSKIIQGSYDSNMAKGISRDVRQRMKSARYQEVFDERLPGPTTDRELARDTRDTMVEWEVIGGTGEYKAKGVGQGIEGITANYAIIDDPLDREMARSAMERERVYHWYVTSVLGRLSSSGKVMVVMTRWHEADLAGRLLREAQESKDARDWDVVRFPALADAEAASLSDDPRDEGEPLWPEQKNLSDLRSIREKDPKRFASNYQQKPKQAGGTVIETDWTDHRWDELDELTPGEWYQSWDFRNEGESEDSSYAVGQLWLQPDAYPAVMALVEQVRGRWGVTESLWLYVHLNVPYTEASSALDVTVEPDDFDEPVKTAAGECSTKLWRRATPYVEFKADGRTIYPMCEGVVPGQQKVEPTREKLARLASTKPYWKSANVWLPNEPWVDHVYVPEVTGVPSVAHDDQADCTSQILNAVLAPDEEKETSDDHWANVSEAVAANRRSGR